MSFILLLATLVLSAAGRSLPSSTLSIDSYETDKSSRTLELRADGNALPPNIQTEGITENLLHDFHLFAEYAAATYAPINNNSTGTPLQCSGAFCKDAPEGNCPQVEAAKAFTAEEFANTPIFDNTGYVAIDNTNRLIVIAFRGTESVYNWVSNIKVALVKSDFCDKCHIHQGFWENYLAMRDMVRENALSAHEKYPDYRLVAVGHSLGGALATIAAADIRRTSDWMMQHTESYAYAAPMVGNGDMAAFLSTQTGKAFRITSKYDPVVRLPPRGRGYRHMSPEYYIRDHAEDPKTEDFRVCIGYDNEKCARDWSLLKSKWAAHRMYWGKMSACNEEEFVGQKLGWKTLLDFVRDDESEVKANRKREVFIATP